MDYIAATGHLQNYFSKTSFCVNCAKIEINYVSNYGVGDMITC